MAAVIQVVQNIGRNEVPAKELRRLPRKTRITLTVLKNNVSVVLHQ
jgi:hypothetical protein